MRFGRKGLVLGVGTVLAPVVDGENGTILIDGQVDRLQALLSAAYGRAPPAGAVGHVCRAAKCWNDGDAGRAELHLALTGLSKGVPNAKRLFLADALLRTGIEPSAILKALNIAESGDHPTCKLFNPGELRNPKGDGVESGEWTTIESEADSPVAPPSPTKSMLERTSAARLIWLALRATGGWAALGLALVPAAAALKSLKATGNVPGYPGMTYRWDRDGTLLVLSYLGPDGGLQTSTARLNGGVFRDDKGRLIGKLLPDGQVAIEPAAAFDLEQREEPKKCPHPEPDYPGRRSPQSLAYENYIKSRLNPLDPTPPRIGVQLPSLLAKRGLVYYDDCQRSTGMLAEMKWGYTDFIANLFRRPFRNLGASWIDQATRQVDASQGRPITWFFSEKIPAQLARKLFDSDPTLARINVVYAPYRPKR